jgi:mono/diheme cytochrome c family protein
MTRDAAGDVRLQTMLSLGETASSIAEAAMMELLDEHADYALIRDAAVTGLRGRERRFLESLLARSSWFESSSGRREFIRDLAQCIAESRDSARITELLELAARLSTRWQQYAIVDGIAALLPPKERGKAKNAAPLKPLRLASEPAALSELRKAGGEEMIERLETLDALLVWPGKQGFVETAVTPLNGEEKKLFEAGRNQYLLICGACHQPNGLGLDGLAPPLRDAGWVNGSPERLTRILLNGVRGPLNVKGKVWELEMPPLNILPDSDLAALMTYVRREWGHAASPVTPEFVAKVREQTKDREEAWTEPELLKVK